MEWHVWIPFSTWSGTKLQEFEAGIVIEIGTSNAYKKYIMVTHGLLVTAALILEGILNFKLALRCVLRLLCPPLLHYRCNNLLLLSATVSPA